MKSTSAIATWLVLLATSTCALPPKETADACETDIVRLFGDACDVCAQQQCCTEARACEADDACRGRVACVRDCLTRGRDKNCYLACEVEVGGSDSPTRPDRALLECLNQGCEQADAFTCVLAERRAYCPGLSELTEVFDSPECGLCAAERCCAEAQACEADERCRRRARCDSGCRGNNLNPLCFDACRDDFVDITQPDIATDDTFYNCVAANCDASCRFGSDFSCVDVDEDGDAQGYAWPTATTADVSVYIQATSFQDRTPWAGVTVTACSETEGCGGSVTANQEGIAALQLSTRGGAAGGLDAFRGYFEWTGDGVAEAGPDWRWILQRSRPDYRDRGPDSVAPFGSAAEQELQVIALTAVTGATRQDGRPVVSGSVVDCHGFAPNFGTYADGLVVELEEACRDEHTRVAYRISEAGFDTEATGVYGQFAIVNVLPSDGTCMVTVRNRDGEVVASIDAQVREGAFTALGLWPREDGR